MVINNSCCQLLDSCSFQISILDNILQSSTDRERVISTDYEILYKSSNIKLLIPQVTEAGPGNIVPTSSTIVQLSLGDALAIATMKYRNFGKRESKTIKIFYNKYGKKICTKSIYIKRHFSSYLET